MHGRVLFWAWACRWKIEHGGAAVPWRMYPTYGYLANHFSGQDWRGEEVKSAPEVRQYYGGASYKAERALVQRGLEWSDECCDTLQKYRILLWGPGDDLGEEARRSADRKGQGRAGTLNQTEGGTNEQGGSGMIAYTE